MRSFLRYLVSATALTAAFVTCTKAHAQAAPPLSPPPAPPPAQPGPAQVGPSAPVPVPTPGYAPGAPWANPPQGQPPMMFPGAPSGAWMGPGEAPPMRPYYPPKMAYIEGAPIPPGYRESTQPRFGLAAAGFSTFGALYTSSLITAGGLIDSDRYAGPAALFVPAVGPFIGLGAMHPSSLGGVLLVLDGLGQTAGLSMAIAAFAAPARVVVRTQYGALRFGPIGLGGVGVSGDL